MNSLRQKMFSSIENKQLMDRAQEYAYEYLNNIYDRDVYPNEEALSNLINFDESLPESVGSELEILKALHLYGSPATVAQIGGRYFGLVNGGIIPVSLACRWLADVWDQNTPFFLTSPIAAKLEEVTESWLLQLLGLPKNTVAGFVSGSSMAIFCGLAAARYRLLEKQGWDVNKQGLIGAPKLRVVTSRHSHGAVVKAISLLGFGTDNIEWVDVDQQGRICVDKIPTLDSRTILVLQAGNVNSGAFDNFNDICDKANSAGAWVHIDGAFGLWAAASTQLNYLTYGISKAHSWSVDGHKTLNTPYDNGISLCCDKDAMINALQASGSYLAYSENRDGMLFTPEMSRRARSIELWAALKFLGKQGSNELIYGLHERAQQISQELRKEGFHILNDVVFNQVLVTCDTDELTRKVIALLQKSGECWVGGSQWFDKVVIRVSVCSWATTKEDISRTVQAFVLARKKALNKELLS